jgi:hypothetical protein
VIRSIASSAAARSSVSLTRTLAVSAAAMTVTRPPSGSRPTTSAARSRASAIRSSPSVRVPIEALVSTIRTTFAARSDVVAVNGRAAASTISVAISSWTSRSQLNRRRCHGALASTIADELLPQKVEPTG